MSSSCAYFWEQRNYEGTGYRPQFKITYAGLLLGRTHSTLYLCQYYRRFSNSLSRLKHKTVYVGKTQEKETEG